MTAFEEKVNAYREKQAAHGRIGRDERRNQGRYNRNDAGRAGNGARDCKGHLQRCFVRPT